MDYRYVSAKIWSWFLLSKVYVLFFPKIKPQIKYEYFSFFFFPFLGRGVFQIHLLLIIKMIYIILFTDFFKKNHQSVPKEAKKDTKTQFNFVQPIKMLTSKLTKKKILKKKQWKTGRIYKSNLKIHKPNGSNAFQDSQILIVPKLWLGFI